MGLSARFSRRVRSLRWLRVSLAAGALYDAAFAVVMVVAPGLPARILDLPLPGEPFYLWILATFLVMLATLYVSAARDPRRYSAVLAVAIAGRLLGAAVFTLAALRSGRLAGLYPLAAADAAFGISHAVLWRPLR